MRGATTLCVRTRRSWIKSYLSQVGYHLIKIRTPLRKADAVTIENHQFRTSKSVHTGYQDCVTGFSSLKMAIFFQGAYGMLVFLIIPAMIFERKVMLAASQSLGPLFWGMLAGSIGLGAVFTFTRWSDLNDFFDRKGFVFLGGLEDDDILRFIQVPIAAGVWCFVIFSLLVGSLAFMPSAERTVTFDVVKKTSHHRQCRGYKTLPTDSYMKMHVCNYPDDFARTVGARGTVTIRGHQTPVGFRGIEILSYGPGATP